jgi:hypothetical protein
MGGNTASGAFSLHANVGSSNTAAGFSALFSNTIADNNSAFGVDSLVFNTTGTNNTALGGFSLSSNTTGSSNIALGASAGSKLTTGNSNIDIGNTGAPGESGKIRIGGKTHRNTYIAGISGVTVANGATVVIDTTGHLGTITSSARYKDSVKPIDSDSNVLLSLHPVSFRYKKELDPSAMPQFGLVAEDVAKVDPDLVLFDEEGRPYTVRYDAVNAMLLNEFIKEHQTVSELKQAVAEQKEEIEELKSDIKELSSTHH